MSNNKEAQPTVKKDGNVTSVTDRVMESIARKNQGYGNQVSVLLRPTTSESGQN